MPVLMLFDYMSAFPSVPHAWIFLVLRFINFPSGRLVLVQKLYPSNEASYGSESGLVFLFSILSGVLQGCPLSGSLFAIVIDLLLHFFKKHVEDSALASCRACEDDIGMALKHMSSIPSNCKWFEEYSIISGLTLKPSKCIIIVLSSICADVANQEVVKGWLTEFCPSWKDMKICNAAQYLGFFSWPCATPLQ